MKAFILLVGSIMIAVTSVAATAKTSSPSAFKNIFQKTILESMNQNTSIPEKQLENLFFNSTQEFDEIIKNHTLTDALKKVQALNIQTLTQNTSSQMTIKKQLSGSPKKPLLIVIIPGVFAEFIKTRAFEEVFEQPSAFKNDFESTVQSELLNNNPLAMDQVAFLKLQTQLTERSYQPIELTKVFHVSELKISSQIKAKVALLGTPFGSLESLGDARVQADVFNRRLNKLIQIMKLKNHDIALIGYSRGTLLGLEMLAKAKQEQSPWLQQVRGLVSLSGVVWGSTLADDATLNTESVAYKQLNAVLKTADSLETVESDASWFTKLKTVGTNAKAWLEFASTMASVNNDGPGLKEQLNNVSEASNIDLRSPLFIIKQMWNELGLNGWVSDYNNNISRFKYFTRELYASVEELNSVSRAQWWSTQELPTSNIIYYSLPATMVNPTDGEFEKSVFENPLAYGNGSYDDTLLIKNFLDYRKASGISLNDSQVSVVQASFLPKAIAQMNPKNSSVQTKLLGIAGTHHWGLALREVNVMKAGQRNGFPREALLKSLAQQILNDQQK